LDYINLYGKLHFSFAEQDIPGKTTGKEEEEPPV
jgi:hypothetical protein